jgi:hypothetical protein
MIPRKTLVVGASENEERYSNRAVKLLNKYGHPMIAYGMKEGNIDSVEIKTEWPTDSDIHTVTMYIGSRNQASFYNDIIDLCPKRVIFNPGTENREFYQLLKDENIEVVENCTLVMLNHGVY